jgi:hypothetical protein
MGVGAECLFLSPSPGLLLHFESTWNFSNSNKSRISIRIHWTESHRCSSPFWGKTSMLWSAPYSLYLWKVLFTFYQTYKNVPTFPIIIIIIFFYSTADWTQGLALVLYHLSHTSSPHIPNQNKLTKNNNFHNLLLIEILVKKTSCESNLETLNLAAWKYDTTFYQPFDFN